MIQIIAINNETDAWDLLDKAVRGILPNDTFQIDFGDWAEFHLKFAGAKFDSTMTTSMMEAFIELQKSVYRLYAKLHYNDARSILLTEADRRALDILIQISPGSTKATVDLKDALKQLVKGAVNKMDAKHYIILAMVGAVAWTSTTMWKDYLQSQSDVKKANIQVAMSQEETRRLQIFAEAVKQVPHVAVVASDANEARNKILKSAKSADSIEVAGQNLTKDQAAQLSRSSRSHSEEVRLDGEYRIIKVDSSNADHFKVYLLSKEGKSFPAELTDQTITKAKNRELLQEAEWEKKPINLMINGTTVRGEVTTAKIIDVKERFTAQK